MRWKSSGLDVDVQTGRRPAGCHDVLRRIRQLARWSEVAILRPRCKSSASALARVVKGVRWMAAGPHGCDEESGAASWRATHMVFCRRRGALIRRRARGWLSAERVWFENTSDAKICCELGLAQQRRGFQTLTPGSEIGLIVGLARASGTTHGPN